MVLAFEGWNDAGQSATTALRHVDAALHTAPLAEIEPDDFYDFTVRRPCVVLEHIGEIPALTQGLGTFCQVLVNLDIVLRQPVNQFRSFIEVTVNTGFVSFHL